MKFAKFFVQSAAAATLVFSATSFAQTDSEKQQIKDVAVELCQTTAQARYGADSIKKIGKKAKWSKGLQGAAVKMKIKPASKRASKFSCVVSVDKTVKFYKA